MCSRASRNACTVNVISDGSSMTDDGAHELDDAERAQFAVAIGSGRQFAERIKVERQRNGWSQGELARRMRAAGYPIDQAAISKIESPPESDRARRIDIDEAIGFARVFNLSLEGMTLPLTHVREIEILNLLARVDMLALAYDDARTAWENASLAVALATSVFPRVREQVDVRIEALSAPDSAPANRWSPLELQFFQEVKDRAADPSWGIDGLSPDFVMNVDEEIPLLLQRIEWSGVLGPSTRENDEP